MDNVHGLMCLEIEDQGVHVTNFSSFPSSGGRGLLPGVHGQRDDGRQPALRFTRAGQRQPAVEHQPEWRGAQPPQTRPHPGGQRSDTSVFTPNLQRLN